MKKFFIVLLVALLVVIGSFNITLSLIDFGPEKATAAGSPLCCYIPVMCEGGGDGWECVVSGLGYGWGCIGCPWTTC